MRTAATASRRRPGFDRRRRLSGQCAFKLDTDDLIGRSADLACFRSGDKIGAAHAVWPISRELYRAGKNKQPDSSHTFGSVFLPYGGGFFAIPALAEVGHPGFPPRPSPRRSPGVCCLYNAASRRPPVAKELKSISVSGCDRKLLKGFPLRHRPVRHLKRNRALLVTQGPSATSLVSQTRSPLGNSGNRIGESRTLL